MLSKRGPASSHHSGPVPGESATFTCLHPITGSSQGPFLFSTYSLEGPPSTHGSFRFLTPFQTLCLGFQEEPGHLYHSR